MYTEKGGNRVLNELNMRAMKTDISFQTLYRYVSDDVYEHPTLEPDVRELQKLYQLHRRQWVTILLMVLLSDVNTERVTEYMNPYII